MYVKQREGGWVSSYILYNINNREKSVGERVCMEYYTMSCIMCKCIQCLCVCVCVCLKVCACA